MKMFTECLIVAIISFWTIQPTHSQTDGDVRLAGFGANRLRGKLEIFYNGEWGRVCATPTTMIRTNTFELDAANVVCRQLGLGFAVSYSSYIHLPEQRSRFGGGSGPIHLDGVVCRGGGQPHLLRCDHGTLGQPSSDCTHDDDISVECSELHAPYSGEVRLSGGSSGLLELYSTGRWGAVCSEGGFGDSHAHSVCRQLGYTEASSQRVVPSTDYSGLYWDLEGGSLSDASGEEACFTTSLQQLPTASTASDCSPVHVQCVYRDEDAAVQTGGDAYLCTLNPATPYEGNVRLITSGDILTEGPVEVFYDGQWSQVCFDTFSVFDADVVCKQLRFPSAFNSYDAGALSSDDTAVSVLCNGVETDVRDCTTTVLNSSQCSSQGGADCAPYSYPYSEIFLLDGAGPAGNLFIHGGWDPQPVCAIGFGQAEAEVACRQMGYEGAVAVRHQPYYGDDLFTMDGQCLGSETHLLNCVQPPANSSQCNSLVRLQCATSPSYSPSLRLVGGPISSLTNQPLSGRLEVNFDGVWGAIGSTGFDHLSAHVICTQLGYASARQVFNSSRFGTGMGPTILDQVQCRGSESSLFQCPYSVEVGETHVSNSVGIECSEQLEFVDGSLRLLNNNNTDDTSSGSLEVYTYGVWMSVCGVGFTMETATVACSQLGFIDALSYCTDSCFGEGGEYVHPVEYQCGGSEGSLQECGGSVRVNTPCNDSSNIGLVCRRPPTMKTPIMTTPTAAMVTPDAIPTPTVSTIIPGLSDTYFYIIVGVGGSAVCVLLIGFLVCCICCVARRRQKRRGTWRSSVHNNGTHQNGPRLSNSNSRWSHERNSKLAMEKVSDFNDPLNPAEMNGFTHTPSSASDSDPNLDYKPEMSLELKPEHFDPHYENLPQRPPNVTVSNTIYLSEGSSPASPPPGYDELEFLPHTATNV
ncbi:scavenger receptor cysteine-rich domain superfamily protein-like [Halichondria panicea]|uniref:scavenger receptor cysteine-rich domain superfamily protein-like n=1 Tax=Halichondria panicea TaxID=6063 RepID=UPI00312B8CD2